jgi:hypothetical protein
MDKETGIIGKERAGLNSLQGGPLKGKCHEIMVEIKPQSPRIGS